MSKNRTPTSFQPLSLRDRLKPYWEVLKAWLILLSEMFSAKQKRRQLRPWHIRIGKQSQPAKLSPSDIDKLLQRHRDLQDVGKLATVAANFRLPESDFFTNKNQAERLMRYLLEQNPPWLHISKVLAGGEQGNTSQGQEVLMREQTMREVQQVTLFVPGETWRDLPLSSLTMRPAKGIYEVWQGRMLDQVLPPEVLVDRCSKGEILIPIRHNVKQRLDFERIERPMTLEVRKPVAIPIDMEGSDGKGGQLLYILLDYSASMQGKSAVLALAVIMATLRANMGQRETRYLFRRFAEEMVPAIVKPPLQASSLAEKDTLLDTILATNFNGTATGINDAIKVAVQDIEHLRQHENLEASILLVTDGIAHILESTELSVRKERVKIHTVMVQPQPNSELADLSESFSVLDIGIDTSLPKEAPLPPETPQPKRAYHI